MKDWLSKRNLGDDDASGMERDGTDVVQNVAEIVGSFSLEVKDSNRFQVNVGGLWK